MLNYILLFLTVLLWTGCTVEEIPMLPQDKILGVYKVTEYPETQQGALQYEMQVIRRNNNLYITNFANSSLTFEASLIVDQMNGNRLVIPHQVINRELRGLLHPTLTASGVLEEERIFFSYTINNPGQTLSGKATALKQ